LLTLVTWRPIGCPQWWRLVVGCNIQCISV